MKATELKAVQIVVDGDTAVHSSHVDEHGQVVTATGRVKTYEVTISPAGNTCSCPFGEHRTVLPADSHSHDLALRIATQIKHGQGQVRGGYS